MGKKEATTVHHRPSTLYFLQETWAQYLRYVWQLKRQPMQLAMTLAQPLMWLLLFGPAMKGRIDVPDGRDYIAFMLPGIIAFTVFGNSLMAGIPILFDRESGFLTRLMASPVSRGSILVGRALFTLTLSLAQAALIFGLGYLMSDQLTLTPVGIAGILVAMALLSLGLTVISLGLAFSFQHHTSFFVMIGTLSLPLFFLSSALVELKHMPPWMRYAALANPMTHAIDGMRETLTHGASAALLPIVGALVLFNVIAFTWGYRTCSRALA